MVKDIISVREYETIISDNPKNEKYKDFYNNIIDEKDFNQLLSFIKEYNEKESEYDVLDFMKIFYRRWPKEVVKIQNYVGLIQLKNGSKIQILPKIDFNKSTNEKEELKRSQTILWKMLSSMKNFPSKSFNLANINAKEMNLYEIFIRMYIDELSNAIRQGINFSYVNKSNNLHTVKGKIITSKNITQNAFHKEKFYCNYDEYEKDNPENRIIKATLNKLLNLSEDNENIQKIKVLLLDFIDVTLINNYESELNKIVINRQNQGFENVFNWSKVFLENKSFTNFSGNTVARALLFKMDKLFEAYIERRITQEISKNYKVLYQNKGAYLFEKPKKSFALQPDIIIKNKNNEIVSILDTKWKRLSIKRQHDISIQDMNQMYVYAKKYNINNIWLIYPLCDEIQEYNKNNQIYYNSTTDGVTVKVFFTKFSVNSKNQVEDNIDELIKSINLEDEIAK